MTGQQHGIGTGLLLGIVGLWLLLRSVVSDSSGRTLVDHILGRKQSQNALAVNILTTGSPLGGAASAEAGGQSAGGAPPSGIPPAVYGSMPKGVGTFDGKPVANWIIPWLQKARKAGWTGTVSSGYRTFAQQQAIYNSGVRPAAAPGTSNHEQSNFPGGAVDVTNASQLAAILQKLGSPLQWAGSKDPVHFSNPHNGGY